MPATALQIAGRAGRYASHFIEGEVTTFTASDLPLLQKLLNTSVEPIQVHYSILQSLSLCAYDVWMFINTDVRVSCQCKFLLLVCVQQAGLHPTAEQIELFAYHLPKATLSNLIVSNKYLHLSVIRSCLFVLGSNPLVFDFHSHMSHDFQSQLPICSSYQ